jgi:hypothetical protein
VEAPDENLTKYDDGTKEKEPTRERIRKRNFSIGLYLAAEYTEYFEKHRIGLSLCSI